MAKQKKNKEQDVNELAYSIVQQATEENPPIFFQKSSCRCFRSPWWFERRES